MLLGDRAAGYGSYCAVDTRLPERDMMGHIDQGCLTSPAMGHLHLRNALRGTHSIIEGLAVKVPCAKDLDTLAL